MNNFRCVKCQKLLAKLQGKAEIVCPRCKETNRMDTNPWGVGYLEDLIPTKPNN